MCCESPFISLSLVRSSRVLAMPCSTIRTWDGSASQSFRLPLLPAICFVIWRIVESGWTGPQIPLRMVHHLKIRATLAPLQPVSLRLGLRSLIGEITAFRGFLQFLHAIYESKHDSFF